MSYRVVLRQNLARWWSRYAKRNGLEGYTLHQMRHTFATVMVANDVDMVTAADLMGHSDTAISRKRTRTSSPRTRRAPLPQSEGCCSAARKPR